MSLLDVVRIQQAQDRERLEIEHDLVSFVPFRHVFSTSLTLPLYFGSKRRRRGCREAVRLYHPRFQRKNEM